MAFSWVTALWSAVVSACLTLAVVNLLVWLTDRTARSHLLFATASVSNAVLGVMEFVHMREVSPERMGVLVRWGHVPLAITICALVGFVRFYLGAGRAWLAWAAIGTRAFASLVLNFLSPINLHFAVVTRALPVSFLGETVRVPEGVVNPWVGVGQLSTLVFLVFVVDAGVTVWRRGDRRRALTVCGGMFLFMSVATTHAALVNAGMVRSPYLLAFSYLGVLLAMGQELGADVVRARELAAELRASEAEVLERERRITLAARSAELALWTWDVPSDLVWMSPGGRLLYGIEDGTEIDFAVFLGTVHPDDRERVRELTEASIAGPGEYQTEFRIVRPDGQTRWVAERAAVEHGPDGSAARMSAVSLDITRLKEAERELLQQHGELAHLSRVSMLGELSASLAHELNQPLTAILSNAQAAQRLLARDAPDVAEVREILKDIVDQDRRAGDVIQRLRLMLKKEEVQRQPVDVSAVALEVLKIMRSDLSNHGVTVSTDLAPGLPAVSGDRVQLQQVLLNLLMNGSDAMSSVVPGQRQLLVKTERTVDGRVQVSVSDRGCGIPDGQLAAIFEPFVTTKPQGLGLGLAVCRTILSAHGGEIRAENNVEETPGATLRFVLPAAFGQA
jgi:PAS domain S-box-containing protein